jgi:4-methyl-5(b-hydroxyethyl)-thiazole monophosphate biosynthesis
MKGLFVFSHDMEDGEALQTRALLMRAGLSIVTITFEKTLDIKTSYGLSVKADHFGHDVHLDHYDFVVVPGGRYVKNVVDQDVHIKELVKYFYQKNKLVAAICAGPRFLGQAGLLHDKKFTAFPGSEKDMPSGNYHKDMKAITDGHIITGRSAGAVYEFSYEIVKYTLGIEAADHLLSSILF